VVDMVSGRKRERRLDREGHEWSERREKGS
jgi:hypothetical protein